MPIARPRALALALLSLVLLEAPAPAQDWYRGTAWVDFENWTHPTIPNPLPLGTLVRFEFELQHEGWPAPSGSSAQYLHVHPLHLGLFRVWSTTGFLAEVPLTAGIAFQVVDSAQADRFDVTGPTALCVGVEPAVDLLALRLTDEDATVWDSAQLPTHLDLADFEQAWLDIGFEAFPTLPLQAPFLRARVFELERQLGAPFCLEPSVPAPDPVPSRLVAVGSSDLSLGWFTLVADGLPRGQPALLLAATDLQGHLVLPGVAGRLCLAAPFRRVPGSLAVTFAGAYTALPDLGVNPATGLGPVQPGETLCFQVWCRDPSQPAGSRLTSGLQVTFE